MPRKFTSTEHLQRPEPKHGDLLASKFINCLMRGGKKTTAQNLFYDALKIIGFNLELLQGLGFVSLALVVVFFSNGVASGRTVAEGVFPLLADVAAANRVLPEYVDLIIDEAHHLESAVTNGLSFRALASISTFSPSFFAFA